MEIKSAAFKNNEFIPAKYTCQGQDISPDLIFSDIPKEAKSLVLICDDPDAPMGTWDHWVVFNMPAATSLLPENIGGLQTFAYSSFRYGKNSSGENGYGGPCPPPGKAHRYFFKLYALDVPELKLKDNARKKDVEEATKGHILAQAQLIGLYKR